MTIVRLIGLISFILVLNFNIFGQTFPEQELIGTWIVNKFENQMSESEIPSDQKEMMAKVGKAFGDSKFIFQPDKKCVFEFSFDEMAIKNGYWKYDSNSSSLIIQEWKDKDKKNGSVLMGLQIIRRGEKIFFIVEETPFVLEVKRI
jgi:hypothetical protein